jgi:cell division protease FtsH
MLKNLFLWLIIAVILISVFNNFDPKTSRVENVPYSELVHRAKQGDIRSLTIHNDRTLTGTLQNENTFSSYMPIKDSNFLAELIDKDVIVRGKPPYRESFWMRLLISWFPTLLLVGVWVFFMRQMNAGGKGTLSFGRSRARLLGEDQVKITFKDVAGAEEAKEEVSDLVDFLKDPSKVQKLGGKIPRGVLLMGPPGTGKTLLAKAVAGEAKVPFFTISGADFVEMFVGVGAARVRDMFEQAKKHSPCIIFIDELDAVGRHRGAGLGGGNDEREQTLNQLLVEMDGFIGNEGVIVIAATNRPDVLDKALLRPGRFDRQVVVDLPDIQGRHQILNVHLKKIKCDEKSVNPLTLARGTPGFSGADLENLVNEAALFAARANKSIVTMTELEKAKDKVMMGAERHTMVMSDKEKRLTAYHEAGHAIIGRLVPEHDAIHKVTIIPRGRALGLTMFLPDEDRHSYTKQRLESQIASLFGGRLAEKLIFGDEQITTGASNDIQRATEIARNMVIKWGLSPVLGPLNYDRDEEESMSGRPNSKTHLFSEETTRLIDQESRAIIDRNYQLAEKLLVDNMDLLHRMAERLIEKETIEAAEIDELMQQANSRVISSTETGHTTIQSETSLLTQPEEQELPSLNIIRAIYLLYLDDLRTQVLTVRHNWLLTSLHLIRRN